MRLLEGMAFENDGQEIDWSTFTHPTARIGQVGCSCADIFSESPAAGPIARDVLH